MGGANISPPQGRVIDIPQWGVGVKACWLNEGGREDLNDFPSGVLIDTFITFLVGWGGVGARTQLLSQNPIVPSEAHNWSISNFTS